MCFAQNELNSTSLATCFRKFVVENIEDLKEDGLAPFFQGNPAPSVRFFFDPLLAILQPTGVNLPSFFFQDDSDFWAAGQDLESGEEEEENEGAESESNLVSISLFSF